MAEQHNITTISELLDVVTPENIDVLSKDLHLFLTFYLKVKESQELGLIMKPVFSWVDDDKPGLNKVMVQGIEVEL